MERVLITGISGQDGAYLSRLLLEKGYLVYGLTRNKFQTWRLKQLNILEKVKLYEHDYQNIHKLYEVLSEVQPTQIYNLAAQSSVSKSYELPLETLQINSFWMVNLLEWIRKKSPTTRFFQASSSEIFGNSLQIPQTETTPLVPLNPYSTSKAFALHITRNYREIYELFCVNGILYNHDSELRESHFFTQKVSRHVAEIYHGKKEILYLGNLNPKRDIGYAPEYVEGMLLSLNHDEPDDFIFSTGKSYSLKRFVEYCFDLLGISIIWEQQDLFWKGFNKKTGECLIETDPKLFRKNEIEHLEGNPQKAKNLLGWEAKTSLEELAKIMTEYSINLISQTL